jgi:hypothetical protein
MSGSGRCGGGRAVAALWSRLGCVGRERDVTEASPLAPEVVALDVEVGGVHEVAPAQMGPPDVIARGDVEAASVT